ncbi:MAG: hypothetical protein AAB449_01330 [Patescibacteria group bacterium]
MPLEQAMALLQHYGYLVLFPLAVMEGPIITVIAGFLVSLGVFNPFVIYAVIVFGDIVGDAFWYLTGRFGGNTRFTRLIQRMFGITAGNIDAAREKLMTHRFKMMTMAKLAYGIGSAGLVAAGLVRVPYMFFAITCLVVSLIQAAFFLMLGILFGEAYAQIAHYLDYFAGATLVLFFFAIVFGIWHILRNRKQ